MPMHAAQESKEKEPAHVVPQGGLVVVVDGVTRQIREATPDEIGAVTAPAAAAQGAKQQAGAAVTVFVQRPDGSVGVTLGPEFEVYAVATATADGKVKVEEAAGGKALQDVVGSEEPKKSGNEK